jgi:hypothetical protein
MYLLNAFSLNMLSEDVRQQMTNVTITPCNVQDAAYKLRYAAQSGQSIVNAIGHADTAAIVAQELADNEYHAPQAERASVTLSYGDRAIVAQYVGPRLPEGATTLPEGARIEWFALEIQCVGSPRSPEPDGVQEISYSDQMGSRNCRITAYVVAPDGAITKFKGENIPGLLHVAAVSFVRNGKWSHNSYRLWLRPGVKFVSWRQNFNNGLWWPQATWDEAITWFRAQAPNARSQQIEEMIRRDFPKSAERFDAAAAALKTLAEEDSNG